MRRDVSAFLDLSVHGPAELAVQVAVSRLPGLSVQETLDIRVDGSWLRPQEVLGPDGNRLHVVRVDGGRVHVAYSAQVTGTAEPLRGTTLDRLTYLRPSRYAESDRLGAVAVAQFGDKPAAGSTEQGLLLVHAVAEWVFGRIAYIAGSSGPSDSALDTFLSGAGVCRDFAHLVVGVLRALEVPARLVAVYAPGLWPMDFHAVAEALVDGQWYVVDGTRLAPRSSLLRLATGRDAADTAFLSSYGAPLDLLESTVMATVQGDLPLDDHSRPFALN